MAKGRTVLIMQVSKKGRVARNYRPIGCLAIMWILLTGIIGDEIYGMNRRVAKEGLEEPNTSY